jgi:hypothetical protein
LDSVVIPPFFHSFHPSVVVVFGVYQSERLVMAQNMTEGERKAMGAQLSAAAYAQPPIVPEDLALTVIVISGVTIGLATIVVALRMFVRFPLTRTSKGWGLDDTFALLAYVSIIPLLYRCYPNLGPQILKYVIAYDVP